MREEKNRRRKQQSRRVIEYVEIRASPSASARSGDATSPGSSSTSNPYLVSDAAPTRPADLSLVNKLWSNPLGEREIQPRTSRKILHSRLSIAFSANASETVIRKRCKCARGRTPEPREQKKRLFKVPSARECLSVWNRLSSLPLLRNSTPNTKALRPNGECPEGSKAVRRTPAVQKEVPPVAYQFGDL